MTEETMYGQFCPVAKASEILTTRWTPLIMRELISGSHRFNEIHRGVPLMSRALLSKRLKDLEKMNVIERVQTKKSDSAEYHLTVSGKELRPIIVAMGVWGTRWLESNRESNEWDAGVLMWDIRRRLDLDAMPNRERTVLHFDYSDTPSELRLWWVVVEDGEVDLCQSDPGYEVNLYFYSTVYTIANIWMGKLNLDHALDDERLVVQGDLDLEKSMKSWFQLSVLVEATERYEAQLAR